MRIWLALFLFCLVANAIGGKWLASREGADLGVESTRVAAALMHGHGFRDPYGPMPTGPTAHAAPLYPAFYATLMTFFGTGVAGWWAIRIFTIAAYSAQLALLPSLATALRLNRRAGLLAAGAGALVPIPGSCYKWEAIFAGLVLTVMAYFIAVARERQASMAPMIAAGVLCGVGLLVSPVLMPVWLGWMCVVAVFMRARPGVNAAALVLPLLIISPWIIRNYRVFNAVIFVRDNLGTELAASNNDCASSWARDNQVRPDCFARVHPNANRDLDRRIVEIGEYRFNMERQRAARAWILTHPGRFLRLTAQRCAFFWFPPFGNAGTAAKFAGFFITFLTLASIPGLVALWHDERFAFWLIASCLFLYPVVFYLVQVELRFRYPILWVTLLLSGVTLEKVMQTVNANARWSERRSDKRRTELV